MHLSATARHHTLGSHARSWGYHSRVVQSHSTRALLHGKANIHPHRARRHHGSIHSDFLSSVLPNRNINGSFTFYLHGEDPQVPELLLVVLSQEAETFCSFSGDVEGDSHTVPWLHSLRIQPLRAQRKHWGHPIQNCVQLLLKVSIVQISFKSHKDCGVLLSMWTRGASQAAIAMITADVISAFQYRILLCC